MSTPTSPIRKAWYTWKSLKLPWRKRFLVGLDLQGNTFWEFRDTLSSHKNRMRRIVQYPASTHYSEIKVSPQWHQWLRHTRFDPPSLAEQSQDVIRQQNLKVLVAEADAKWAAKPSFLHSPDQARGQPLSTLNVKSLGDYATLTEPEDRSGVHSATRLETRNMVRGTGKFAAESGDEQVKETQTLASNEMGSFSNAGSRQAKSPKVSDKNAVEDPWKQARGGPSEEWQPSAWDGEITVRR